MLIYDRRRCRPLPGAELRRRLTLAQRAKLNWLESTGWSLLFLRGEPAQAFVSHSDNGLAAVTRDGRVVAVRSLSRRPDDHRLREAPASQVEATA